MIIFILTYIFIFMLSIELFTAIFQVGGLSRTKARFQVLSLLTNSGFKTKESELITNDNFKRKVAVFIMVYTYVSLLVFMSSVVYIAVKGSPLTMFVYVVAEIVVFYNIFTMVTVKKIIYNLVYWFSTKHLLEKDANTLKVIEEYNTKVLATVTIHSLGDDINNVEIQTLEQLSTLEIQVLCIERQNVLINTVLPTQKLTVGDKVTVYGDLINIQFLFKVTK